MKPIRAASFLLLASIIAAACGPAPTATQVHVGPTVEAAVQGTVQAAASQTASAAAPTAGVDPSASSTPVPTVSAQSTVAAQPTDAPTVVQGSAVVSVSLATNCRTGPNIAYPLVFTLQPGQHAEIKGRSSDDSYWYITNPDQSSQSCWIVAGYATVQGDVASLPVVSPEAPPPSPPVDFTMYRHSFTECGVTRVSLVVTNVGNATFKSAKLRIEDLTATNHIYGPNTESNPFGDNPSSCPKDKGSGTLAPGATAYIVIPMPDFHPGNEAAAYVELCTGDNGSGSCETRAAYFRLPAN